jgi:hypothetical protein
MRTSVRVIGVLSGGQHRNTALLSGPRESVGTNAPIVNTFQPTNQRSDLAGCRGLEFNPLVVTHGDEAHCSTSCDRAQITRWPPGSRPRSVPDHRRRRVTPAAARVYAQTSNRSCERERLVDVALGTRRHILETRASSVHAADGLCDA